MKYSDSLSYNGTIQDGQVVRTYDLLYFEIPLMIKMKTKKFGKMSYYGQIGLGTGFSIKNTIHEDFQPTSGEKALSQTYDTGITLVRESVIIGLGAEYHLDESSRILVGISYSNGLNNILTGVNHKSGLAVKGLLNYVELNLGFLF